MILLAQGKNMSVLIQVGLCLLLYSLKWLPDLLTTGEQQQSKMKVWENYKVIPGSLFIPTSEKEFFLK